MCSRKWGKSTTQDGSSAPEGQMTLCFTKMRAILCACTRLGMRKD
uniref:Uncharacterized protein n=1 Tax=Anguilla anguilla TaxID=7936 RepID=A0A0E9TGZ5_ANGAN